MIPDPRKPGPYPVADVVMDWLHDAARSSWAEAKEIRVTGGHDSHAEGVEIGRAEAFEFVIKMLRGEPLEL